MIVKCDQCQTRFKIPDEKVTEKGVKVRCSRCQNTFRVARSPEAPPAAPAPAAPSRNTDPFAGFGADLGEVDFSSPREPTVSVPIPTAAAPIASTTRLAQLSLQSVPRDAWGGPAAGPADEPLAPGDGGAPGLHHDALFGDADLGHPPPSAPEPGVLDLDRTGFNLKALPRAHGSSALDAVARAEPEVAPAPAPPRPRTAPPLRVVAPPAHETPPPQKNRRVRRASAIVANLGVASLLVVGATTVGTIYLNQGEVTLSDSALEPVAALLAGPSELVALDVSNGLYETRGGKPLFYVRGEVQNRSGVGKPARVRVRIVDGALKVAEGVVIAGKAPSPEELHAVTTAAELAALARKLDDGGVVVRPGARVPFLVAFYDYPPDLGEYRLKISVENAQEAPR